jgi:hypothetical protein
MPRRERQQTVLDLLRNLRGLEPLKELFWSELNYERVNEPLTGLLRRTAEAGRNYSPRRSVFAPQQTGHLLSSLPQ